MNIYLGLDSSTQSLTALAIAIDGARRDVLFEHSLAFDEAFPDYGTRHGVLPQTDQLTATSSPVMWAEALDRMMAIVAESGIDLSSIRAISGSGQQHGSVYLNAEATPRLEGLDTARPIAEQVDGMLSRSDAPIWMDSSTTAQCAAITNAVGGADACTRLTGSRAVERFTGPQIRKFAETDPDGYARTDRIHLVSSFLASLLAGRHAPIDFGDGAGMNLMDIARREWAPAALAATAQELARRLPALGPSWSVVGTLATYWREKYGYPAARVIAWSGDNPCSLIGTGIVHEGRVAISLGTSDTLFGFMREPHVDPTGSGHAFGSPTGDYMSLVCCRNGSLARERVRDAYGFDWDGFGAALGGTPVGNRGAIMLPWFEPEITPAVLTPGVHRYGLDEADGPANVRAVVEAQMLALAIHSRWMGVEVKRIHATGGASANRDILQVMADVHDADVYQFEVGNSACLGAALRAYHADHVANGESVEWRQVIEGFAEPVAASRVSPVREHVKVYAELAKVYEACEAHATGAGGDPHDMIERFHTSSMD